jgi:hypothetical protein
METKLSKASHWAQILSFILALWLVVRPVERSELEYAEGVKVYLPYILPVALVLSILLAAGLHFAAAVIARKSKGDKPSPISGTPQGVDPAIHNEIVNQLSTRESELTHCQGEVDRVRRDYQEQLRLARDQCTKSDARISNLEQQLRVNQGMVDNLREEFSVPNGRFELEKVRYVATESRSLELRDFGKLPEKDLTEFF